jgi:hypothetical protein
MSFAPTSPITGTAQTGLTSPTYTHLSDSAPDSTGKQVAVSALGGTQTGVTVSSISSPFTLTFWRPKTFRQASAGGVSEGNNVWRVIARKGVVVDADGNVRTMLIRTEISVPAGADIYDAANVRAACSAHFGLLSQQSAGIGDSLVTGVV